MMHTKEPWVVEEIPHNNIVCIVPHEDDDWETRYVTSLYHRATTDEDAQRIVACVNACAGIANPEGIPDVVRALKLVRDGARFDLEQGGPNIGLESIVRIANNVLAKLDKLEDDA